MVWLYVLFVFITIVFAAVFIWLIRDAYAEKKKGKEVERKLKELKDKQQKKPR